MNRRSNIRNPSPSLDENASDAPVIIFSHAFVLRSLLELLKENESSEKSTDDGSNDREGETVELDEELEHKLCSVWDMSIDPNVAYLLIDSNFIALFKNRIESTSKPRLWEILIGIIGNVLCSPHGQSLIDEHLWEWLLSLCSCPDSQTLIQVMRCLKWCAETHNSLINDQLSIHMDHYKLWDNLAFIFKFTNNRQLLLSVIDFLDTLINLNCREITENLISNGKNLVIGLSQFECYPDVFDDNDSEVWTFKYHLSNIFQCLSSSEDGCNIFSEIRFDLRNSIIESVLKPFRKLMQEQRVGEAPQNHDIWCLTASLSLLLWLGKIIETAEETPMKILRGIEIDFEKLEFNDDELKHVCYETLRKLTE